MALREKDRNRKNLEFFQRLIELSWKGITSISTKAMAVETKERKKLRNPRQRRHWLTSHCVKREEEVIRVPRFSCLSPVTGWVVDVIHGERDCKGCAALEEMMNLFCRC